MSKFQAILLGLVILCASHAGAAERFDGSKPLLCAVSEAYECVAGEACEDRLAAHLNAPEFLRIDVKKKTILGTERSGKKDVTKITGVEQLLILHGVDAYHGWSVVIGETGKMSLALSAHHVALILFGACTVP